MGGTPIPLTEDRFYEHKLTDVYCQLAKLLKVAVTLPVTSASEERVHSKLKLVKSALRSTSADDRMSDLVQMSNVT